MRTILNVQAKDTKTFKGLLSTLRFYLEEAAINFKDNDIVWHGGNSQQTWGFKLLCEQAIAQRAIDILDKTNIRDMLTIELEEVDPEEEREHDEAIINKFFRGKRSANKGRKTKKRTPKELREAGVRISLPVVEGSAEDKGG